MKVGFVSLGCSKNQIDTERMLAKVAEAGYEITGEDIEADVLIVHTCAFIESAKQESIDNILDVAWLKKHRKLKGIVVTGCLAERYRDEIFSELPEVDAIIGVGSLNDIVPAVEAAYKGNKFSSYGDKNTSDLGGNRIITTPHYTAYLKIAEGCDNHCTYCAIPMIRGKFRSRPIEEIVEEAKELERMGIKELNLIAQDTSRYGLDLYGDYALAKLVKAITKVIPILILQSLAIFFPRASRHCFLLFGMAAGRTGNAPKKQPRCRTCPFSCRAFRTARKFLWGGRATQTALSLPCHPASRGHTLRASATVAEFLPAAFIMGRIRFIHCALSLALRISRRS